MTTDTSITKSDRVIWREKLERAAEKGIVFQATGTYVKLRRWSPRRYHNTMTPKMIKEITRIVVLKTKALDTKNAEREAASTRKQDALESAYFRCADKI